MSSAPGDFQSARAAPRSGPLDALRGPSLTEQTVVFSRYRVVRELGRGGMGVVFLVNDEELGTEVALKVLPDLVFQDDEALAELKREVRRGISLTHPGIVRTYGLVRDETMAGIVMEYVDGGTLALLKRQQPGGCFDVEDLLPWLEQLCPILDFAHRQARIAHRDIKPRNLMVGSAGQLKVADFGISSVLCETVSRVSLRGHTSGTPAYMSPQQILGGSPSHLDDIYALGATIYELLTSKPPFHRGQIVTQVQDCVPPPMGERRLELGVKGKNPIPESWEATVAACLAKAPVARPQSATEVLARLKGLEKEPATGNANLATRPDPMMGPPASVSERFPRRARLVAAAVGVAALVLGAAVIFLGDRSGKQTATGNHSREASTRADHGPGMVAVSPADPAAPSSAPAALLPAGERPPGGEGVALEAGTQSPPPTTREPEPAKSRLEATVPPLVEQAPSASADPSAGTVRRHEVVLPASHPFWKEYPEIPVEAGDRVTLDAAGRITWDSGERLQEREVGPEGAGYKPSEVANPEQFLFPDLPIVALIGRIGDTAFGIGKAAEITAPAAGCLRLGINGRWRSECWTGNRGEFKVVVTICGADPGHPHSRAEASGPKRSVLTRQAEPVVPFMAVWPPGNGSAAKPGDRKAFDLGGGVAIEFCGIPEGGFVMGSPASEQGRLPNEPQREEALAAAFWMARTEVTQAQWQAVMKTNPGRAKNPLLPVEMVSWHEAVDFCRQVTAHARESGALPKGWEVALPTEVQWEYACRAGSTGPHAGDANPGEVAWLRTNSDQRSHPVGTKIANAWGLHDMHGNVFEWCADWHGDDPGFSRVFRGGSFSNDASSSRSAYRGGALPVARSNDIGFRPVLVPAGPPSEVTAAPAGGVGGNAGEAPGTLSVLPGSGTRAGEERRLDAGGGLAFTMCWIPAGEFDMGTSPELVDDTGLSKDERWHHVRISQGFWLAKGECANSQWQALMGAGRPTSQAKKQPAANISWDDCQAFLRKLRSPLPGWRWSLPTEAQWEYACRAGTTGLYGGSGNLDEMGWHDGNSAQQAHPVGMKKANAWGLCDMHGNVAEWCADWHGDYPAGSVTDPVGPDGGTSRVTRGGSWFSFSAACRSASRAKALPSHTSATVGFRVALVPAKPAG